MRFQITLFPLENINIGYSMVRQPGAGMINIGNSCYLNACLQALLYTPPLFNFLRTNHNHHTSKCDKQICTLCPFIQVMHQSLDCRQMNPNLVSDKLKLICKDLVPGHQEDAHEFFR